MNRLFRQHPHYNWIKSLPGVGHLNGARLLARLGDNRNQFDDVDMLRATAGTVPITRSSGKRRSVHFRQACSRPLRKIFYDIAMKSKAKSPWAKEYFQSQRARGHAPARANRALANRWVGIIWKLWETSEMYDESKHQTNRQRTAEMRLAS
jgi:transposase